MVIKVVYSVVCGWHFRRRGELEWLRMRGQWAADQVRRGNSHTCHQR